MPETSELGNSKNIILNLGGFASKYGMAHLKIDKIEPNLHVPEIQWCHRGQYLYEIRPCLKSHTVDGQKVPDVYRRLISQKVSVSHNLSQKVIPSDV